jgi:hypothetical protein
MNDLTKPGAGPTRDGAATPTADDWARFLHPLLASVQNPPNAQDFRKRIAAIAFGLPQVTTGMLTTGTQREAVTKFVHWPTVAEVAGLFVDALKHEREVREFRDRPLFIGQDPAQRTPEEIEAVKAKAAEAVATLRAGNGPETEREPVAPRYLAPKHLLAVYERQAREGSTPDFRRLGQMRLDALRKQFPDQGPPTPPVDAYEEDLR